MDETILINKIEQNHGVLVYKKAEEHRKNYILRDINNFVKYVSTLPNFVYALAQGFPNFLGSRVNIENYGQAGYNILYGNYINNALLYGIDI